MSLNSDNRESQYFLIIKISMHMSILLTIKLYDLQLKTNKQQNILFVFLFLLIYKVEWANDTTTE